MKEIILYNYFRSSTSFRVRIALNLKGLDFEYRPVNLLKGEQHSDWYRKINPLGGVPALVHRNATISQSVAILEYLDEAFPNNPLYPKDPLQRAKVRQIVEDVNSYIHPMANLQVLQYLEKNHNYDQSMKNQWVNHWFQKGFLALEKNLAQTSKSYCFGIQLTAADVTLVPAIFTAQRFDVSLDAYPTIKKIFDNCMKLDAFTKAAPANQPDTV